MKVQIELTKKQVKDLVSYLDESQKECTGVQWKIFSPLHKKLKKALKAQVAK